MAAVRPAAVAGSFYPADPRELAAAVDDLLAGAVPEPGRQHPVAVVVPHAGYAYSGPVAASGYAYLAGSDTIRRVAVLGPAHFVDLDGLAVPTAVAMHTPLGLVASDTAGCRALVDAGLAAFSDRPHAPEHSLEVQLPFLQRILGADLTCVPVAVGRCEPGLVADALESLSADLVVVSTDLSHYLDQTSAQQRDRHTAAAVVGRQPAALTPHDACGCYALRGLLQWAVRRDLQVELVDLRTSADTVGNPRRVVGYGAFVLT